MLIINKSKSNKQSYSLDLMKSRANKLISLKISKCIGIFYE